MGKNVYFDFPRFESVLGNILNRVGFLDIFLEKWNVIISRVRVTTTAEILVEIFETF